MIDEQQANAAAARRLRFTFYSSNGVWGGSEELWSRAAAMLRSQGHEISVIHRIDVDEYHLAALAAQGCRVFNIHGVGALPRKLVEALKLHWPIARRVLTAFVGKALRPRPDLVIISQPLNFDGHFVARLCHADSVPYLLISQKAADMYWPADKDRPAFREMHQQALETWFVSEDNQRLTEEQLGCRLTNARIVRNPYQVNPNAAPAWPEDSRLRLACVARMDVREKGQDMLLRMLARAKWRARPVSVNFFGEGVNEEGLQRLASMLLLRSVGFPGFTHAPEAIWTDHHALILPSHCEGLPLSLVEVMLMGRVAITTDVGGAREVLSDGVTGFIATAPSEDALDDALERAWQRRTEWPSIGAAAAAHIRQLVPVDPVRTAADMLYRLASG